MKRWILFLAGPDKNLVAKLGNDVGHNENESFKRIQNSLKKIKLELGKLEKHNRAAARAAEANCAYKWQQKVGVLHAEATEDLLRFFPSAFEDGMVITPKGGGSR